MLVGTDTNCSYRLLECQIIQAYCLSLSFFHSFDTVGWVEGHLACKNFCFKPLVTAVNVSGQGTMYVRKVFTCPVRMLRIRMAGD